MGRGKGQTCTCISDNLFLLPTTLSLSLSLINHQYNYNPKAKALCTLHPSLSLSSILVSKTTCACAHEDLLFLTNPPPIIYLEYSFLNTKPYETSNTQKQKPIEIIFYIIYEFRNKIQLFFSFFGVFLLTIYIYQS